MSSDFHISDQVQNHFSFLFNDYGYQIVDKGVDSKTFGNQWVTLRSGDIYLDFILDRRDEAIDILLWYKNDRSKHINLGQIFKFLTNDLEWFKYGRPYFIPRPFIQGEENITDWQIKRLAELTTVMWPKIEEVAIPKSRLNIEYHEFDRKRKEIYEKNKDDIWDTYKLDSKLVPKDRGDLKFNESVKRSFGFLIDDLDFVLTQPSDLFLRFESKSSPVIYVNVFHTKNMFRLGIHTAIKQDPDAFEKDYSLDEFSRLSGKSLDPWPLFAKDHLSVSKNVAILADHFNSLCSAVIEHDISVFERLEAQRINYAYEVVDKWLEQEKHNPLST
jgi:hypothetical protein